MALSSSICNCGGETYITKFFREIDEIIGRKEKDEFRWWNVATTLGCREAISGWKEEILGWNEAILGRKRLSW